MIDYIKGTLVELSPTEAVIEQGGIGYSVNITLQTYSALSGVKETKLYIYEAIREDAHLLYGFENKTDRKLFLLLLSVSGVGANTARIIMSSMTSPEIKSVILAGDVKALKSVKGIGAKTAQRIVLELADKMGVVGSRQPSVGGQQANQSRDEALTALTMLGFAKPAVEKLLMSQDWRTPDGSPMTVEEIIKEGLKRL
jgi:Holliday junction DNA helicase RuvA